MTPRPAAIVLAAGLGTRFGGAKLLARLDGRPILQHVLDALAAAGIDDPVVVLGPNTDPGAAVDDPIEWRSARRVLNPDPGRGLATSLQLGWAATRATHPGRHAGGARSAGRGGTVSGPEIVVVALGDQPRLDPAVVRRLLAEPLDPARPVVVARHADGSRNPVRLEREAGALVEAAIGDRGLGPLLDARPDLVRTIDAGAANPDVDRPVDLAALVEAAWADRVRANAEQVERFREAPDGRDFYATVSRTFVADPARAGDPVLDALLAEARPTDTWLDVGAGAGRYALPVARRVRRVVAIDPSASMLAALRAGAEAAGIANVDVRQGRWPADRELRAAVGPDPIADVGLIAHVSYDIADIGAFVGALEAASRRRCVAVLMEQSPAAVAGPFWPLVHGEERVALPALPQFLELLDARGRRPEVVRIAGERRRWADRDELVTLLRRQLWTAPGSAADGRLLAAVDRLARVEPDGSLSAVGTPVLDLGVVAWDPPKPVDAAREPSAHSPT